MLHAAVPRRINSQSDVMAGVRYLIESDPVMAAVRNEAGEPDLRRQPAGLASLLFMITEQMISLKAAAAIWARVEAAFSPFDPQVLAAAPEEAYRACGLSGPKLRTMRHLGEVICDGRLDLAGLERLEDDQAIDQLKQVKGIGDWTAEVYLLACLGRADVWPAGDLALQVAVQTAFEMPGRPDRRMMCQLAEGWRPARAVAARMLWTYYRKINNMPAK